MMYAVSCHIRHSYAPCTHKTDMDPSFVPLIHTANILNDAIISGAIITFLGVFFITDCVIVSFANKHSKNR